MCLEYIRTRLSLVLTTFKVAFVSPAVYPLKGTDSVRRQSSSSSAFQARPLGFTILGEIFAYVTVCNPNIEVVTFRLRGWCMLGVSLLPAVTRLGHECQDVLSPRDGMHVCTD